MQEFAMIMLTVLVVAQGALMLAVELNSTHATNPNWPGHARFHLVWQNLTTALFSLFETGLVWWNGPFATERFFLVAALTAIPLLGFIVALLTRHFYGGTMFDQNGVPPLRVRSAGRIWDVDGNTLAVVLGCFVLLLAITAFLKA